MKKKILLLALITLLLMPLTTIAKESDKYKSKNFIETLEEEKIKLENKNYKETDKQVTIYMFRGTGCTYCRSFLNFLNDISEDYGKYFKLVSYEVWRDTKNGELLEELSSFLGQDAGGVPYIIIGEHVFGGYSEEYDDTIKAVIKEEYNKSEKYDALEEYEKAKKEQEREEFLKSGPFQLVCNAIMFLISTIVIVLFINKKSNDIINKIEESKLFHQHHKNK